MIKKIFFINLLILPFSSCTFITKKVESLVNIKEEPLQTPITTTIQNKKKLFCFEKNKTQLMLEDESTAKYYQQLMPNIFESKTISFIQKSVMLSLIEMARRPDVSSPTARFQYYLHFNDKNYYFEITPSTKQDKTTMPLLKGVDLLLKKFESATSLTMIAKILDSTVPNNTNISSQFDTFLHENRKDLLKNDFLTETFFKGDEVLTKHEYFKRLKFQNIISYYNSENLSSDILYKTENDSLINIKTNSTSDLKCNTDINSDAPMKEKVLTMQNNAYHYYAISEGNNSFVAVTSISNSKPFKNINNTYLINNDAALISLPMCQFKNKFQDITLFSLGNRNPSQHFKHLISYEIDRVESFKSLEELLNFSRHLFLNDPDRILYESQKGRKSQLEFFLTMKFPIYHVDTLGDIFGIASFKNKSNDVKSLVVDSRTTSIIRCSP